MRACCAALLLASGLLLSACGEMQEERAASGAGIGAAAGAGVGAIFGGIGAIPGAIIGGVAGAGTGAVTDPDQIDLGEPVWRD